MQAKIKIEPFIFLKNVMKIKDAYFCAIAWHQNLSKILCTYLFWFYYNVASNTHKPTFSIACDSFVVLV
jgi:hypothetical protein